VSGLNQDRFGSATRESPDGATFGLGGETLLENLSWWNRWTSNFHQILRARFVSNFRLHHRHVDAAAIPPL